MTEIGATKVVQTCIKFNFVQQPDFVVKMSGQFILTVTKFRGMRVNIRVFRVGYGYHAIGINFSSIFSRLK